MTLHMPACSDIEDLSFFEQLCFRQIFFWHEGLLFFHFLSVPWLVLCFCGVRVVGIVWVLIPSIVISFIMTDSLYAST